jgi:hypothetical protein
MARIRTLAVALIVILLVGSAATVAAPPDFSGTWKMDPTRGRATGGGQGGGRGTGGGLGLGSSADELTIRQDAKSLVVDERRGTATARITYSLDGHQTPNALPAGRNAGALARYVSHWDGSRLVTRITAPAEPGSKTTVEYQEVRTLDRDGSMVVETTLSGEQNSRTVVYLRKVH